MRTLNVTEITAVTGAVGNDTNHHYNFSSVVEAGTAGGLTGFWLGIIFTKNALFWTGFGALLGMSLEAAGFAAQQLDQYYGLAPMNTEVVQG